MGWIQASEGEKKAGGFVIELGFTYTGIEIQTYDAGLPANATSVVCTCFRNGAIENGITVTVGAGTAGRYLASFTAGDAGDGWVATDHVVIRAVATIDGEQYPAIVFDSIGHTLPVSVLEAELLTVGSSGNGARTVTITVNDGTTAINSARVRLTEGGNEFTANTNVSGIAVFNVDDGTYVVSITKSGYSYAGTTLVVNGAETVTYSMTEDVVATPPDDPLLSAVTIHVRDQFGVDMASAPVEITFVRFSAGAASTPLVLSPVSLQNTDEDGLVTVNLYREAEYKAMYGTYPYTRRVDFTVPDAGTYYVEE